MAIVTGGASGLGKGIAERLVREGATVVLFDRDETALGRVQKEFEKQGLKVDAKHLDVGAEEQVGEGVQSVVQKYGKLEIMVNCAGIGGPTNAKISDYKTEDFDLVYRVNLRGTFLMTKYSVMEMVKGQYGRILLISSMAGKEGNPLMAGYCATKAGVIGLVKGIGKEYADAGITINGIAPGVIWTPLVEASAPQTVRTLIDKIPMKRTGTIEEMASTSCWIVSKECSFTTGFIFDLSGGRATY